MWTYTHMYTVCVCACLVSSYQYTCNDTLLCKCLWKNRGKTTTTATTTWTMMTISLTHMCVCVCICIQCWVWSLCVQGGLGRRDRKRWTKSEAYRPKYRERSCVYGILLCVKTYRICVKVFMCWIQFMCARSFLSTCATEMEGEKKKTLKKPIFKITSIYCKKNSTHTTQMGPIFYIIYMLIVCS